MLSNVHQKETELLAKKHGRATNQKSSFTNLLKGKITRPTRPSDDKENEKTPIATQPRTNQIVNQTNALKIKEKSNSHTTHAQKNQKLESQVPNKKHNCMNKNTHESSIEGNSQISNQDLVPISLSIEDSSKFNTLEKSLLIDAGCMTDDYYQKQLEIKVQILKKERDQLWDSINGIVRQNNFLKASLEEFISKKESSLCQDVQTERIFYAQEGFQTESIQMASHSLQTDISDHENQGCQTVCFDMSSASIQTEVASDQIQLLQLRYQKAMKERAEVLQFCETLYLQDISQQLSECLNMKEAVTEYLSMKIDGLLKQFDSQKTMLNRMYEEYINKFKRNEDELLERNQALLIQFQEAKINNKKLQQNAQTLEKRVSMLEETKNLLNSQLIEAQEEITEYQKQAELIKESLFEEKKTWEAKKKTYTNLLAASHRTINNLMAQMKEFEGLASSTYYKRLKMEKNEHSFDI